MNRKSESEPTPFVYNENVLETKSSEFDLKTESRSH